MISQKSRGRIYCSVVVLVLFVSSVDLAVIATQPNVCVLLSVLTVGRLPDDGEEDLILRRVMVEDAERRVGDDDPGVFLHVDAAD